jgi:hypothetical protein
MWRTENCAALWLPSIFQVSANAVDETIIVPMAMRAKVFFKVNYAFPFV